LIAGNPKQRFYDESLLRRAIEFHGHGGPFMVIGLRMGLLALEELNARGWFDIEVEAELNWAPPDSCILDGIQVSTGCTIGKRNIRVKEQRDIAAAVFTKGEHGVRVEVRGEVLSHVREEMKDGDHVENEYEHEAENLKLMKELAAKPACQLFIVSRFRVTP